MVGRPRIASEKINEGKIVSGNAEVKGENEVTIDFVYLEDHVVFALSKCFSA